MKCAVPKLRSWTLLLVLAAFLLDRLLKWCTISLPESGAAFSFGSGLSFGYYPNPALFFFPAWGWIPWVALAVLTGLLTFWFWNFIRNWELGIGNSLRHPLIPILLGGASNVFDRFVYKGVIDYVNILGFATINLADILIFTGLIFTLTQSYDQRR